MAQRGIRVFFVGSFFLSALIIAVPSCVQPLPQEAGPPPSRADYATNVDRSFAAAGIKSLTIHCGPGALEIVGEEGRDEVAIEGVIHSHATAFVEAKRIAGEVRLDLRSLKTENPVIAVADPLIAGSDQGCEVDLMVKVPDGVALIIQDAAGRIEISGMRAGARVTSIAGPIEIEGISGGLRVSSGGGPCTIRDASGRIHVTDGAGDLTISEITGDIEVQDTNGMLVIRNVTGNVVAADNPRGARISNIDGDLTLYRIEHAACEIEGVLGKITHAKDTP
ncbi:MAG: hypothetical protein ACE5GW_03305 [Planctomycetota bacterium]